MILYALQIAAVACIALYFIKWRNGVRRRNSQTWDSLLMPVFAPTGAPAS